VQCNEFKPGCWRSDAAAEHVFYMFEGCSVASDAVQVVLFKTAGGDDGDSVKHE
jgi:hypothetical protein